MADAYTRPAKQIGGRVLAALTASAVVLGGWLLPAPASAAPAGCTIVGTAGADVLTDTDGPDVICGLGGDDLITGGAGADRIEGGPGADTIDGGDGDDVLLGEEGRDRLMRGRRRHARRRQ